MIRRGWSLFSRCPRDWSEMSPQPTLGKYFISHNKTASLSSKSPALSKNQCEDCSLKKRFSLIGKLLKKKVLQCFSNPCRVLTSQQKNLRWFYCEISGGTCQVTMSKPIGVKLLSKYFCDYLRPQF